jgi:penicillin amidase
LIEALVPDRATCRLIPPGDAQSLIERLEGLEPERRDALLADTPAAAWATCVERMGEDPSAWAWGRLHRALFAHPLSALGG